MTRTMLWHTPHTTQGNSVLVCGVSASVHLSKAVLRLLSSGPTEFFFWGRTNATFKVEAYIVEYSTENAAQYPVAA